MNARKNLFQIVTALVAVFTLILTGCGREPEVEPLRIAFIPGGDIDTEMALFAPIVDSVSTQIDRPIEIEVATSYAAVVEALRNGHVDLARLGPFTYILARNEGIPIEPLVVESLVGKGTSYQCWLIARTDAGVEFDWTPEAASQLTLALVEEGSTSGSILPQAEMLQYDPPLGLDSWLKLVWSGSHNASIAAVQERQVDLAFVASRRLDAAIAQGVVAPGEIEVLWSSGDIPNSPFVARSDLGIETLRNLTFAFQHVPGEVLAPNIASFEPAADSTYTYLYRVGEQVQALEAR
ncbi:MAG: phosphate/phosphite/phosphonate ABC transporter substrate-binding protein [Candidatus Pacebacteria bacterium]|nr:phosphate/phosphite/phosphonate ABC transporter substrate-binding protein [Candidatus Paceibacterota bacterium]